MQHAWCDDSKFISDFDWLKLIHEVEIFQALRDLLTIHGMDKKKTIFDQINFSTNYEALIKV